MGTTPTTPGRINLRTITPPTPPEFERPATPTDFAAATGAPLKTPLHIQRLQLALRKVEAGRIRRLLVCMPPRHGKSEMVSVWFPSWYLCRNPSNRIILTSYGAKLPKGFSRRARDIVAEHGPRLYGVGVRPDVRAVDDWEVAATDGRRGGGGMKASGVGGSITGHGANLLIIDDPIKDAKHALSDTKRQADWDWYESTSGTRLEPEGAEILTLTRWHEDDLGGRALRAGAEAGRPWTQLVLPAISHGEGDALGRPKGEPLWPGRYSRRRLREIRANMSSRWWSALFDQDPTPEDGEMFRKESFPIAKPPLPTVFTPGTMVRYWDLAGSTAGDWTVGVKMARVLGTNLFAVIDVQRFREKPGQRNLRIKQTAERDGREVYVYIEQEPGSSGVAQVAEIVSMLAGWVVQGRRPTGDKVIRADAFASQCEIGNVILLPGAWNQAYIDEFIKFPNGTYDDQVDATSGAFNEVSGITPFQMFEC